MIPLGTPVYIDKYAYRTESRQVKFPRSKKKRIRNKWAKQTKNYKAIEIPCAYFVFGDIYAHPAIVAKIKKLGVISKEDWNVTT